MERRPPLPWEDLRASEGDLHRARVASSRSLDRMGEEVVLWRAGSRPDAGGEIRWAGTGEWRLGKLCREGSRFTIDHRDAKFWFRKGQYDGMTGQFSAGTALLEIRRLPREEDSDD